MKVQVKKPDDFVVHVSPAREVKVEIATLRGDAFILRIVEIWDEREAKADILLTYPDGQQLALESITL